MRKSLILAAGAFLVAFGIGSSFRIAYIESASPNQPPELYISFMPHIIVPPFMVIPDPSILPSLPGRPLVAAVVVGWILGVAYGIYLFERARGAGAVNEIISEKINNVR